MTAFGLVRDLRFELSEVRLEPLQQATEGGWTRHTTVVSLHGDGHVGAGEDVCCGAAEQQEFQAAGPPPSLAGTYTLEEWSHRLDEVDLFPRPPEARSDPLFRRWAFESAALDLALRQADRSLAEVLGLRPAPVRFVLSMGLGDPASTDPLKRLLDVYPDARFKLDLGPSWNEALVRELAALGSVRVVDLKGQYRGSFRGPPANPDQYRQVAEVLPDVWIEDPALEGKAGEALAPHLDRVTWDAVLHSVADIAQLPFDPECVNIKPSRFGFVSEVLRAYEYCAARGIATYGGGQFELGPGRRQIQELAALFHPDAPNDVAPSCYNDLGVTPGLPTSPLSGLGAAPGFGAG